MCEKEQMRLPFVSVIIPVYNDPVRLRKCLQALEEQTYPKQAYEVIAVDNGSEQSIEPIVVEFRQAKASYESRPGPYAARNKGLAIARGEIIAFTDSDCIPAQDWIERGVTTLQRVPDCGFVGGKITIFFQDPEHPTAAELYDYIDYLNQQLFIRYGNYGATANLFTYKHIFDHVGNFAGNVGMSDDREWGQRVASFGYPLIYADDTRVAHPARYSLAQLLAKERRIARGHVVYKSRKEDFPPLSWNYDSIMAHLPPLPPVFRILRLKRVSLSMRIKVFIIWFVVKYAKIEERLRMKLFNKEAIE